MQIFNSLSKKLELFKPVEDKKVILYVCGLTPFDSNTTTSPPGKKSFGNPLPKKNMVEN